MPLNIEYKKAEAGWIKITLHGESGSLDIDISEVYDPFEDWFYALERIYRHEIPSIIINPEARTYRIDIISVGQTTYYFRVVHHETNNEVFACTTTREEVIVQMYGKLMEFIKSDRYDPEEYEDTYSSGFPLKDYYNQTLDLYLEGKAFDRTITHSKCPCCDQYIIVNTIDEMLKKAYAYIDANPMLQKFLQKLNLDKTSIGISQNYTRKKGLSKPFRNLSDKYRDVQGTDANIFLGFSEDFGELECIEIFPTIFDDNYIRGWHRQYIHLNNKQKLQWLENLFLIIDPQLSGATKLLEYDNVDDWSTRQFKIQPNHPRLEKYSCIVYPENNNSNSTIFFEFDRKNKNRKLKVIRIQFDKCTDNCDKAPLSKWLHQESIEMYPDFGDTIFWFGGKAGTLESFGKEYNFDSIMQRVKDWMELFYENDSKVFPDWDRFNEIGKELCKDIQEIVKDRYIIVYDKCHEEKYGNEEERAHLKLVKDS